MLNIELAVCAIVAFAAAITMAIRAQDGADLALFAFGLSAALGCTGVLVIRLTWRSIAGL